MSTLNKEELKTPFDKDATVVEKKDSLAEHKWAPKPKRHNVIIVRNTIRFKTLVIQAKNLLKNQFNTIELHAVDDESYLTITLVAQCLLKYGYVSMDRLKTKTHQTWDKQDFQKYKGKETKNVATSIYKPSNHQKDIEDADPKIVLQPKLVIHLSKCAQFDSIYDKFEENYKKAEEDHAEEIAIAEKNVIDGPEADWNFLSSSQKLN